MTDTTRSPETPEPTPGPDDDGGRIGLAHGAGGKAMRNLVTEVLTAGFPAAEAGIGLDAMDDGAVIPVGDTHLVLTTDSHVIQPPFFPGGDIGRLAIAGTVNDLAVMGATDVRALTSAVIIEANYPISELRRIARSMADACAEADAAVVTGDTKVMGNGELDGVVINTTGVGAAEHLTPDSGVEPNDVIIVTDAVGEHGISLLAVREGIDFRADLESDVKPLNDLVGHALDVGGPHVHAMKDPTRMGLAGALNEMAAKSGVGIEIREDRVPVKPAVKAAGELLGIDPFQIANEGVVVLAVAPQTAEPVLAAIRDHPKGGDAAAVGKAIDNHHGRVLLDTGFGNRYLREPTNEPAPRIC